MKQITVLIFLFTCLLTSGLNAEIFTFEWMGTVTEIVDGNNDPAAIPGVGIGDVMTATVTYDPADFGTGIDVTGDGLDYAAPAGLQLQFQFSTGGRFSDNITGVRARDGGAFDQWNWNGGQGGGLLFQANDFSDSSFDLPLSTSFVDVHDLFLNTLSNFSPSGGNRFQIVAVNPADSRVVTIDNQSITVNAVIPEPSTYALFGAVIVGLTILRQRNKRSERPWAPRPS